LNSYKDAFEITTDPQGVKTLNIKGQITDDLLVFVTGNGTSAEFSGAWYPPEESLNKQQMVSSVRIDFIDSSTYTITDETTQTSIATRSYSSGDTIELNGWKAVLENTPVQGDRFTISLNTAARGDNRNMHVMTALQTDRAVFQGRGNFSEVYSDLINELGSVVVQSSISRDAQQVLTDEAKQARDSVSAVSLDEEAADLLRFQQAYQASAQVIQAANKLFDSILALR
jgi:flagellar hook-associated protein FlgK